MTDFSKLEAVIKARTPGPWERNHSRRFAPVTASSGRVAYCLLVDNHVEDATFIAAMGTIADLMLDALNAVDAYIKELNQMRDREAVAQLGSKMEDALIALKAAQEKLP